jgi:CheY-like chemotaxis protein
MNNLRILHVDDDRAYLRLVEEVIGAWNGLAERPVNYDYRPEEAFRKAMELLQEWKPGEPSYDVVMVDIKDANTGEGYAGIRIIDAIKKKLFVPIILHSALSGGPEAQQQTGPFVWNVPKNDWKGLKKVLDSIPESKAHQIGGRILETVLCSLRQEEANFLWALADGDVELFNTTNEAELVDNIVQRLASKLLVKKSLPSQYYIRPPFLEPDLQGGDILKGSVMKRPDQVTPVGDVPYHHGYWVVVTASCDLERGQGHIVTLARAIALTESDDYKEWACDPTTAKNKEAFTRFLTNRMVISREYVLPGWFDIPFLVVDFEATVTVPFNALRDLFALQRKEKRREISQHEQAVLTNCRQTGFYVERIASLNSPFSEQVTSRYGYKYGRVGVAELEVSGILKALEEALHNPEKHIAASSEPPKAEPT